MNNRKALLLLSVALISVASLEREPQTSHRWLKAATGHSPALPISGPLAWKENRACSVSRRRISMSVLATS